LQLQKSRPVLGPRRVSISALLRGHSGGKTAATTTGPPRNLAFAVAVEQI